MNSIQDSPKLCECGCGAPAPISTITHAKRGYVTGQPMRFIKGHYARTIPSSPLAPRFWAKVDRSGGPDACWPWLGGTDGAGYGCITHQRHTLKSNRVAWELTNGPLPPGMESCHHCDVPACCNPAHLFAGTHRENMLDMRDKGRYPGGGVNQVRGNRQHRARFTNTQVLEIRARYAAGAKIRTMAREYAVSQCAIDGIVHGKTWRHLIPASEALR